MRLASSTILTVGLFASLLLAESAFADEQGARSLAANCTGCHGPNGISAGAIPALASLDKARIVAALQEFRAGTRQATVMHQLAKGYTDQEIEVLAEYFSSQKR